MSDAPRPAGRRAHPLVRQALVVLGFLLMLSAFLIGPLPGPGFIIVFPLGLAIVLRNSQWAKRLYVRFKKKHPNKGRWADWGLRRQSAVRREERLKGREAEAADLVAPAGAPTPLDD